MPELRCVADIVYTREKLAVFVDGCFWHSCPQHKSFPKANGDWWSKKLGATVQRDRRNDLALTQAGWDVIRLWTHCSIDEMVATIEQHRGEAR